MFFCFLSCFIYFILFLLTTKYLLLLFLFFSSFLFCFLHYLFSFVFCIKAFQMNSEKVESWKLAWYHEGRTIMGCLWSRFVPPTGANGGRPGPRPIGPSLSHQPGPKGPDEPGPMAHVARPAPGAHEPGPMPPLVPVLDWTGTNGLTRPAWTIAPFLVPPRQARGTRSCL